MDGYVALQRTQPAPGSRTHLEESLGLPSRIAHHLLEQSSSFLGIFPPLHLFLTPRPAKRGSSKAHLRPPLLEAFCSLWQPTLVLGRQWHAVQGSLPAEGKEDDMAGCTAQPNPQGTASLLPTPGPHPGPISSPGRELSSFPTDQQGPPAAAPTPTPTTSPRAQGVPTARLPRPPSCPPTPVRLHGAVSDRKNGARKPADRSPAGPARMQGSQGTQPTPASCQNAHKY